MPRVAAVSRDYWILKRRRNPFIAREGLPIIALLVAAMMLGGWFLSPLFVLVGLPLLAWLVFVFRDPRRRIPASPLGVVSPVDGEVIETGTVDSAIGTGQANRILIRVDSFGAYTARSPAEGTIMDFSSAAAAAAGVVPERRGLWVQTDEKQDIVLQFSGYRFGLAPRAFLRFGERVGQGQRCAYLRLARLAEVQVPLDSRALVSAGQRVTAGTDLLARLPPP